MTGCVELEGSDMVFPGDRARIRFRLEKAVGVEAGMRFAVREGGKTVGAGMVIGVD